MYFYNIIRQFYIVYILSLIYLHEILLYKDIFKLCLNLMSNDMDMLDYDNIIHCKLQFLTLKIKTI